MIRIPPELDGLMWALAEENNSNAIQEFVSRYPIYREELLRRQSMLTSLRSVKPAKPNETLPTASRAIPRFSPRDIRRLPPDPRKVGFVSCLALLAIAAAAFTVTKLMTPPRADLAPLARPVPIHPPQFDPGPPGRVTQGPPSGLEPGTKPEPNPPAERSVRPQTLVVKRAALKNVLEMLGLQSGISIVLAPGMPDPEIAVEYHDQPPMTILRDLGDRYSFTPFDQGDGTVVIYPAVDPRRGDLQRSTRGAGGYGERLGG